MPDLQFDGQKLYYTRSAFFLVVDDQWIQIHEPINWDKIDITIAFDALTMAFKFEFTDGDITLGFDRAAGYDAIRQAYRDRFEQMNVLLVYGQVTADDTFDPFFVSKLNFSSYEEDKYTIQMNCERQSFSDKFRTRFDTPIDLFRGTSINGLVVPQLVMREVYLHPRLLTKVATMDYDNAADGVEISLQDEQDPISPHPWWKTTVPPLKQLSSNIDGLNVPIAPIGELIYVNTDTLPPGTSKRRVFFDFSGFTFRWTQGNTSGFVRAGISIYKRSNITITPDSDFYPPVLPADGGSAVVSSDSFGNLAGTRTITCSASGSIDVGIDEAVYMKAWVFCPNNAQFDVSDFMWLNTSAMTFKINEQTVADPTTATGPMIHEAINRQLELILDVHNPLRSDFFGRTDLGYAADGCGAYHMLFNGLMIRKFQGKPFNLDAKSWFNSLSGLFCMGIGVEIDDDGNETIRLEPAEYFFRNTLLFHFSVISDYKKGPANQYINNELEFGFRKYPQDNQQSSLEDWMTNFLYMPPVSTVKKRMTKIIDFILSGYYFEYTRIQSFLTQPTETYETDADTFMAHVRDGGVFTAVAMTFDDSTGVITAAGIIALVKGDTFTISSATGSVTNGTYVVTEIEIPFAFNQTIITVASLPSDGAGTGTITIGAGSRMQVKRDEDFQTTINVPFPKTVYNLHHHVKRIMIRWAKIFNSSLFRVFDQPVQFITGANNTNIYTALKDTVTCRFGSVQEGYADGVDETTPTRMQLPLFKAELITFAAPISWEGFRDFRKAFEGRGAGKYGYFEWVNPDGETEKGYILEMKFNPVTQIVKCQMIEKYGD